MVTEIPCILQDENESATNGAVDDDVDLSSPDSSPKRITGYICLNTVNSCYLKVKGTSETLGDIRTSTYQFCRIEENTY